MHAEVAKQLGIPTDHREERVVLVREVKDIPGGMMGPFLAFQGEDPSLEKKVLVVVDRAGKIFVFVEVEHEPAPGVDELWWSPVWRTWVEIKEAPKEVTH